MVNIKPMTGRHLADVRSLLENTPEFKEIDVKVALELCDAYLDDPRGSGYFTYVGMVGPVLAGYFCAGPTPLTEGVWDLYWIAVNRRLRGQGIGRALLGAAEERAKVDGVRMLLIETSSTREYLPARRFYRAAGYKVAARVRDFYTVGDDKVLYRKDFLAQA
jgi:ribosomal protein S18 acetylase RimI-like enzyme